VKRKRVPLLTIVTEVAKYAMLNPARGNLFVSVLNGDLSDGEVGVVNIAVFVKDPGTRRPDAAPIPLGIADFNPTCQLGVERY
jgi:hypothetical protein